MPHRSSRSAALALTSACLFGPLALPTSAPAQVSPQASLARLKAAEGLKPTLFAAEPMVQNPTNIDVDSRGRVWVAEGRNYRMTHRKDLPPVPGADRIKILEDTDGDGAADKVTVFAENISPVPMGLAVEERYDRAGKYQGARVYVGNSPDLLVLEDSDGDDKADKRSALLTGFGGVDSDHGVHGMSLAMDGKLYFTHGDGCCSYEAKDNSHNARNFDVVDASGRRVMSSNLGNTLRVDRDGTNFEVLADRQRNNYEVSVDSLGHSFVSDNDDDGSRGCRVIWIMDGGSYGYRTPGSPRHWGEDVPGIVPKIVGTGNGSPAGIMVYEGNLLGPKYKGGLFEADAGTRQVNFFPVERHGAAFRTRYEVLLSGEDSWFRPVDATAGPDGSVFVADWYDAGVGGHAFREQDAGRIYRVAPEGASTKPPRPDFATVAGLVDQLRSPAVAPRDAARRSLIARGDDREVRAALFDLFATGNDPTYRARALWVRHAIEGDDAAVDALKDADPSIREQAVRILGRDLSRVGAVTFTKPSSKTPPRALAHAEALAPMALDPDAGVRRELALAFRWLPEVEVGDALKALVKGWDGQDRWYLEALGLTLADRDSSWTADLFNGNPFGPMGGSIDRDGKDGRVALPPFFPADRNEAYVAIGAADRPATPVSKLIGLAWRLHRPESLAAMKRIMPRLADPGLQQAADDALGQVADKAAASVLAEQALDAADAARRSSLVAMLARRLTGPWQAARTDAPVTRLVESSLESPSTRIGGIGLAVACFDARYGPSLFGFARDESQPESVRVAAIEAVGKIRPPGTPELLDDLIASARAGKPGADAAGQAAVRALPEVRNANPALLALIGSLDAPTPLRRVALRTYARPRNGGTRRLIELVKDGKLPDDLRGEATLIAHEDHDGNARAEAEKVLPAPKARSGRPLPPARDLAGRDGDPGRGRAVFFRPSAEAGVACGSCHRVQGQGRWVGPDLSTIGTKYGKEELFRSIIYPSAAIGYDSKTHVLALGDGRVVSGLMVEDSPDRVVLKLADGRREVIAPGDVADRKVSDVSLMPEGLPSTMTDREFVDLVAFLATLKQPVSVVGQYRATGPVAWAEGAPVPAADEPGKPAWSRLSADAEGRVDLGAVAGADPATSAFLAVPMTAPGGVDGRLVVDGPPGTRAYLDGKELPMAPAGADAPASAPVALPAGPHELVLRVAGGARDPAIVVTVVAPKPVEFRRGDAAPAAR